MNVETGIDILDSEFVVIDPQQSEEKDGLSIAYSENLSRPLRPSSCVHIVGIAKPMCTRFAVNLRCSEEPDSDIAFHINPRLSQRYVVRNSRIGGRWGTEETTCVSKLNLFRNQQFEMDIFVGEKMFFVSINGKHMCAFVFRVPLNKVKNLQVEGSVKIVSVEYKTLETYPHYLPTNEPYVVPTSENPPSVSDDGKMDVPIIAKLQEGFRNGWQLEIHGKVKILPSSFFINLQEGTHMWPHPVVHLHLNPRFNSTVGKYMFVRNSWTNGQWDQEERCPGDHFSPGSSFSMAIRRSANHFSVWIDGQLAGEFKYRVEADKIDALYIQGDVVVHSVFMRTCITDKYFTRKNNQPSSL